MRFRALFRVPPLAPPHVPARLQDRLQVSVPRNHTAEA